ncbi:MAG: hypothetical protein JXB10_08050 [Pirellulales bacterium]|nr:hypothetical protein [Pirellulales bacterium]
MNDSQNPYAAPKTDVFSQPTAPIEEADAEVIRRNHIAVEASIKSIGTLYFIGSGSIIVGGIIGLFAAFAENGPATIVRRIDTRGFWVLFGFVCFYALLAALGIWVGIGLRRLKRSAWIAAGVFSSLGLFAFPVGTLINAYILSLLLRKKGQYVFTPEYKAIIQQTPHVKYRFSVLIWIFLILFIILPLMSVLWLLAVG